MPFRSRPRHTWQLRSRTLHLGERTLVMGILNVTPDSFSDGGRFLALEAAVAKGLELIDSGADILDIGAESTRPGATELSPTQEQARLLPALESIHEARPHALLSVDTYHGSTARAAVDAGAEIINDVSGLAWDPSMLLVLADRNPAPGLVLMHTRGTPREWSSLPPLDPSAIEPMVSNELKARLEIARRAPISPDRIILDPGFGFGKLGGDNYHLLACLSSLHALGHPILVGLSRKGFLAHKPPVTHVGSRSIDSPLPAHLRLHSTIAANTAAILSGAHVIRVHDVCSAIEAAGVADAILATL